MLATVTSLTFSLQRSLILPLRLVHGRAGSEQGAECLWRRSARTNRVVSMRRAPWREFLGMGEKEAESGRNCVYLRVSDMGGDVAVRGGGS